MLLMLRFFTYVDELEPPPVIKMPSGDEAKLIRREWMSGIIPMLLDELK